MKIPAYLPDDSRKSGSEQLLDVVGPGTVPVVRL